MTENAGTLPTVKRIIFAASITLASSMACAGPFPYKDIFVFGDSLSDTGNTASILGNSPRTANAVGYGINGRF
jgi:phospholipase/lecithinase/hemolysin